MSLLNVWVSPSRAVVCVDTHSATADRGRYGESSKMAFVPHSGVVVAARGYVLAIGSLFAWLANNGQEDTSIDGIPSWLPEQLNAPETKAFVAGEGLQVAVVGHSRRTNRFRAFRFCVDKQGEWSSKEISPAAPYFLAPGGPWTPSTMPVPDNRDSCMSTAKRQVEWSRENHPGEPIGGRLLIAELTRKEARIYEAGKLD